MRKAILMIIFCAATARVMAASPVASRAMGYRAGALASAPAPNPQSVCPNILSEPVVTVAPNQPEVELHSTVGIINALCDVTLDIVGCGFTPTAIKISCDTNGDGIGELAIPLKDIAIINRLLLQARIPALSPELPGSAFPLACCGGIADITFSRTVTDGDDNAFGGFTQTQTCKIDLGIRAPVVISASPSDGDCAAPQNLIIPGSCFLLADGKPNVTSVFAVERGNPSNAIQSKHFVIINTNLIDALFDFGGANAGKTFLIFASGPNGTSRNLASLPPGAQSDCPLGNEQGVMVSFTCKRQGGADQPGDTPPPPSAQVHRCDLERDPSGPFKLVIRGNLFKPGLLLTVGGGVPKKALLKDPAPDGFTFTRIVAKKKLCGNLPGIIVVTNPLEFPSSPFFCDRKCSD